MSNKKNELTGTVYVLRNPAMPGLIKIGVTQGDTDLRLRQLFTTGVPLPFECVYAATVRDYIAVEKALHTAFMPQRVNRNREFFELDPNQVIPLIKLLEVKDVTNQLVEELKQNETIEDTAAVKAYKPKRPVLNFKQMNIPIGSELVSLVDPEMKVIVIGERKVTFQGEEVYLTNATKKILNTTNEVAPTSYWSFNGRALNDIYEETYLHEE